ncbi:MAG: hypothetical protein OJJ54_14020 [Pseudonocardia sp.]|nr:hypothetical protein [Pseudonocardia sp.]
MQGTISSDVLVPLGAGAVALIIALFVVVVRVVAKRSARPAAPDQEITHADWTGEVAHGRAERTGGDPADRVPARPVPSPTPRPAPDPVPLGPPAAERSEPRRPTVAEAVAAREARPSPPPMRPSAPVGTVHTGETTEDAATDPGQDQPGTPVVAEPPRATPATRAPVRIVAPPIVAAMAAVPRPITSTPVRTTPVTSAAGVTGPEDTGPETAVPDAASDPDTGGPDTRGPETRGPDAGGPADAVRTDPDVVAPADERPDPALLAGLARLPRESSGPVAPGDPGSPRGPGSGTAAAFAAARENAAAAPTGDPEPGSTRAVAQALQQALAVRAAAAKGGTIRFTRMPMPPTSGAPTTAAVTSTPETPPATGSAEVLPHPGPDDADESGGAHGPAEQHAAVRDRLLEVLLTDPEQAVDATVDLDSRHGELERLTEAVRREQAALGAVLRRLLDSGLSIDQVARLANLPACDVARMLGRTLAPAPDSAAATEDGAETRSGARPAR